MNKAIKHFTYVPIGDQLSVLVHGEDEADDVLPHSVDLLMVVVV